MMTLTFTDLCLECHSYPNPFEWLVQAKKRHKSDFVRLSDDLQQIRRVLDNFTADQRFVMSQLEAAVQSKTRLDEVASRAKSQKAVCLVHPCSASCERATQTTGWENHYWQARLFRSCKKERLQPPSCQCRIECHGDSLPFLPGGRF